MRSALSLLSLLAFTLFAPVADAQVRAFDVASGSRIQFTSDAPLETIRGTSQQVTGQFSVDPAALATATGSVSVPVASIRTGSDLRDQHLRSDSWLDAASFPNATFELTGVSGASSLTEGSATRVTLRGRFTIHGRTRNVTARGTVTWNGANISVRARFNVRLTDYGVSIPSIVELKVSNDIVVDVSLRATQRG